MYDEYLTQLEAAGVDISTALVRFGGNIALYEKYLSNFPQDILAAQLKTALEEKRYSDAFEDVHSLKGVVGNLGFTKLYDATCVLTECLRANEYDKAVAAYETFSHEYVRICAQLSRARHGQEEGN